MNRYRRFYPDYLLEVVVTIAVCIEAVLIVSLLFPPTVGRQIDLTRQFLPKPEWYFLWLFEIIGYFPGKTAFIGTVLLPLFFVIVFLAIPYIDRGPRGPLKSAAAAALLLLSFIAFTLISILK